MPWKPLSPCAYPGCPRVSKGRYCDDHEEAGRRLDGGRRRRRKRRGRRRRGLTYSERGGAEWVRTSKAYREVHPHCERCLRRGQVVDAAAVHHRVAVRDGGTDDWDNLESLCSTCHAVETSRECAGWREEGRL